MSVTAPENPMKRNRNLVKTLLYLHQQLVRAADPMEMNMSQYHMLHFLHEKPRRAADFTETSKLRKPGITAMVSILESRGWIQRDQDPNDGRAQIMRITKSGLKAFIDFEDLMQSSLESFLGVKVVEDVNEQLEPFNKIWNRRRIERFERWSTNHSSGEKSSGEKS